MLPYVRGIIFSCEVIDLGTPLEVVLSHPNPKPLAQTASSVVYALRRAAEPVNDFETVTIAIY